MKNVLLLISAIANGLLLTAYIQVHQHNPDVDKVTGAVQEYMQSFHPKSERVKIVCPIIRYNTKGYLLCGVAFSDPGEIERIHKVVHCDTGLSIDCEEILIAKGL